MQTGPIQLHGMSTPNVVKVVLMLEELGLTYDFNRIDVFKGDQHTAGFRTLNPNGKVPALVDPDGPDGGPITVFESGAILIYLAEKSGRFLPQAGADRYAVMQWLMFQMAGVGPMFGQAIHFQFTREAQGDAYGRRRYVIEMQRLIEVLERRLSASPYLAGADYSIADMAVHPWLDTLAAFFREDLDRPAISRWRETISARPAMAALNARMAEFRQQDGASMKTTTPEQRDIYYGRTAHTVP
jgi:GST-like protein